MIKTIAVYDANGKYLFVGSETYVPPGMPPPPPEGDIMRQAALQGAVGKHDGFVNLQTQYHCPINNVPVDKPPQPSDQHEFDYPSKQWIDPRTLTEHKAAAWDRIKLLRDAQGTTLLSTPYGVIQADAKASAAVARLSLTASHNLELNHDVLVHFTLANNHIVDLDARAVLLLDVLIHEREQMLREKASRLRDTIDAATTEAQLQAIVWA